MEYYLIIKQFMTYAVMIGLFPLVYRTSKNLINTSSENNNSSVEKNALVKWVNFAIGALVCLICGFVILKFTFFEKNYLFIYVMITWTWIAKINEGYYYTEKLISTLKTSNNSPLTTSEWSMILNIASIITFISLYEIQENIIEHILGIQNQYLSDFLILLFLNFISILYMFISGILIFETFKLFLNLITKSVNLIFGSNIKLLFNRVEKIFHNGILRTNFSTKFVSEKERNIIKYFVLLPPIIIYDVMCQLTYILYKLFISVTFYILLIILRICNSYNKMKMWVFSLSDRRVIILLFRISVVTSIICIVSYNRLFSLVKMTNESTAILEFISSSIMIPVLLSWILELKSPEDIEGRVNQNSFLEYRKKESRRRFK